MVFFCQHVGVFCQYLMCHGWQHLVCFFGSGSEATRDIQVWCTDHNLWDHHRWRWAANLHWVALLHHWRGASSKKQKLSTSGGTAPLWHCEWDNLPVISVYLHCSFLYQLVLKLFHWTDVGVCEWDTLPVTSVYLHCSFLYQLVHKLFHWTDIARDVGVCEWDTLPVTSVYLHCSFLYQLVLISVGWCSVCAM